MICDRAIYTKVKTRGWHLTCTLVNDALDAHGFTMELAGLVGNLVMVCSCGNGIGVDRARRGGQYECALGLLLARPPPPGTLSEEDVNTMQQLLLVTEMLRRMTTGPSCSTKVGLAPYDALVYWLRVEQAPTFDVMLPTRADILSRSTLAYARLFLPSADWEALATDFKPAGMSIYEIAARNYLWGHRQRYEAARMIGMRLGKGKGDADAGTAGVLNADVWGVVVDNLRFRAREHMFSLGIDLRRGW
jgi:hypothetical protein